MWEIRNWVVHLRVEAAGCGREFGIYRCPKTLNTRFGERLTRLFLLFIICCVEMLSILCIAQIVRLLLRTPFMLYGVARCSLLFGKQMRSWRNFSGINFIHLPIFWSWFFFTRDRIDVNLLAIILWLIWEKRNNDRVGCAMIDFHSIRAKVEVLLNDFQSAQAKNHRAFIANERALRWIPPSLLTIKATLMGWSSSSWVPQD